MERSNTLHKDYIESLRVVSMGVCVEDDDEDIVSEAAGADIVAVVSEPVVLVPLAQLTKAVVANKKAAQETIVLKSLLVVFMLLLFCNVRTVSQWQSLFPFFSCCY